MKQIKSLFMAVMVALILMVSVVGTGVAANNGAATVALSVSKTSFSASEGVVVRVTFSNPTNRPVKILKWYTPVEDVEEALFTVSRNGVQSEYNGGHYKRPGATGNDYVTLAPGAKLTRDVNLSQYYNFTKSGTYQIQYNVASWNLFSEKGSVTRSADSLKSNVLSLSVGGRPSTTPNLFGSISPTAGTTTYNKCTVTQQNDLVAARNQAVTYANNSLAYLTAGTQGARYTTWFGTYSSARYNTVKSNFTNISSAMTNAAVKFDCGCKKTYYAYVYPNQPYTIYLCKAFWSAPLAGTDSRGGTLIHEMSHFTVVAGTDDLAYGQSAAKSLAISNPASAVNNADSHEYFAENTPALP